MKTIDADSFFLSANALSEYGAIFNVDCTGNCLTGSLFGHKKVYYVIGTNKIILNREGAIRGACNVAAPKNSMRFNLKNPSAIVGDKCYDWKSVRRLCNSLLIHYYKPDSAEAEVILIDEELGFKYYKYILYLRI